MKKTDEIVRFAQDQAQKGAIELAKTQEKTYISGVLKKCKSKALSPIKEQIEMAANSKMRVVEQFLCDSCDKIIEKPTDGFIVHGNIYLASPSSRMGMIGNNFPEKEENFGAVDVCQKVYCKDCFCEVLDIKQQKATTETKPATKTEKNKSKKGSVTFFH
jgi:hypothetical protein